MTLLEKAKSYSTNSSRKKALFSSEEKELIHAWINDEVSLLQMTKALGFSGTAKTYAFLVRYFKSESQKK